MRMLVGLFFSLGCCGVTSAKPGQIFRCESASGAVLFQDKPCAYGTAAQAGASIDRSSWRISSRPEQTFGGLSRCHLESPVAKFLDERLSKLQITFRIHKTNSGMLADLRFDGSVTSGEQQLNVYANGNFSGQGVSIFGTGFVEVDTLSTQRTLEFGYRKASDMLKAFRNNSGGIVLHVRIAAIGGDVYLSEPLEMAQFPAALVSLQSCGNSQLRRN
jgi:hypothetical protein